MSRAVSRRQQSLDTVIFKPLVVDSIKVAFGGGVEIGFEDLQKRFNGHQLLPGSHLRFTVDAIVSGAGIKWKEDKDGLEVRTGGLNLNVVNLISVDEATYGTIKEEEEPEPEEEEPEAEEEPPIEAEPEQEEEEELEEEEPEEEPDEEPDEEPEAEAEPEPDERPGCFGEFEADHPDCKACLDAEACAAATA